MPDSEDPDWLTKRKEEAEAERQFPSASICLTMSSGHTSDDPNTCEICGPILRELKEQLAAFGAREEVDHE